MADEVTLVFETMPPIPMTVVDGTGINKGAFLSLTDPFTATVVTGTAGSGG